MSLSSALVSSNTSPDTEAEASNSQSPTTSGSPVTPPRYPTAELSSDPRKLGPSSSRAQRLETFEDLLKEAGYSHTRVITPKAERLAKDAATYSSHARDDSHDKDANGADSALTEAGRYARRVANFFLWVSGSTSAAAVECVGTPRNAADDSKPQQVAQRNQSPTPNRAQEPRMGLGHSHSSSGRRLQPKPRLPTSSSNEIPFDSILPPLSSDTIISTTSTTTVRPLKPKSTSPPLRHTNSSPQLKYPSPLGTSGSNTPNLLSSRRLISYKSNHGSYRGSAKPGSSRPNRRSPLPDTWKNPSRPTGRKQRRHHPSDKLLARSGSSSLPTSSGSATGTRIQVMTSPVTVSCRSSSVGATMRHKRKKELPLLSPSAESGAWPWLVDTGKNGGKGSKVSLLPKINIHAANGKLPLTRTGSASSTRGFSSLSRNGSAYTTFSRVGSNSPYASISRAGTSGEYSYRNSPVVAGFNHLRHADNEHTDEGEDDSGDEPHLSNILAPHLSPLGDAKPDTMAHSGPVGRQRSIQSLRACLRRHEGISSSRITSPSAAAFPIDQVTPAPVLSLPPNLGHEPLQHRLKGRSMGNYDERRRREGAIAPSRHKDGYMFDDDEGERGIRRVEGVGAEDENETSERGRTDSRGLFRLGPGVLNWPASSSRSPPYSTLPPPGVRSTRTSSTPARRHDNKGKKDNKTSQKELERERLLWGTSWGRK